MEKYSYIKTEKKASNFWIILARPETRNAFNDNMIDELQQAINEVKSRKDISVLILAGSEKAFCAGADLNWMKRVIEYDFEHNYQESLALADLLWSIDELDIPTIAYVQGPAVGGGVGLLAACDIVLASENTWFALAEVKLGIAPAVISPFLLRRLGDRNCRELFLTGKKIDAIEAKKIGLVNVTAIDDDELADILNYYINLLNSSSNSAMSACKDLLRNIPKMNKKQLKEYTAKVISNLRLSIDGQEGMKAFLEKRKPNWLIDN